MLTPVCQALVDQLTALTAFLISILYDTITKTRLTCLKPLAFDLTPQRKGQQWDFFFFPEKSNYHYFDEERP